MSVLITGGAGFIGQHLARRLTDVRHDVAALDLLHPQVHADPEARPARLPGPVVVGDVADRPAWTDRRRAGATASRRGPPRRRDRHRPVDVRGRPLPPGQRRRHPAGGGVRGAARHPAGRTQLARRLRRGPLPVPGPPAHVRPPVLRRPPHPAPSREDDPHRPVSVYGETKSLGEAVASPCAVTAVPLTVVRPQNVIGPGQALHNPYTGVLAAFLAMLREERAADGLRRRPPDPRLRARRRPRRAARPTSSPTRPTRRRRSCSTRHRRPHLPASSSRARREGRAACTTRASSTSTSPGRRHRARLRRPDPADLGRGPAAAAHTAAQAVTTSCARLGPPGRRGAAPGTTPSASSRSRGLTS